MSTVCDYWSSVGKNAAITALKQMRTIGVASHKQNRVALTNAGYAEVNDTPTQGALDGLAIVSGTSRGRNTLVEIHSAPWVPLWFALFDKVSGYCVYIEVDSTRVTTPSEVTSSPGTGPFRTVAMERIDAGHLYQNPDAYQAKFDDRIFGGNEFRIITIANAVAAGAPPFAVRAFEFHDHYCPGVTSGILMAIYLKRHFKPDHKGYFVHTVSPWCKEDALMVLLNATPGKHGYAVSHPTEEDKASWLPQARNAASIVYRHNAAGTGWEGLILGFEWADTGCNETGSVLIDKLCADLWYLERLEAPEAFIHVVHAFDMPDGVSPLEWARPGVDPLKKLGLAN